jgi:hypothetical protein
LRSDFEPRLKATFDEVDVMRRMRLTFLIVAVLAIAGSAAAQTGPYRPIENIKGVDSGQKWLDAENARYSGKVPISPTLVSLKCNQLPPEKDGAMYYCVDCQRTNPCSCGGSGSFAFGDRGTWSCVAPGGGGGELGDAIIMDQAGARLRDFTVKNVALADTLQRADTALGTLGTATTPGGYPSLHIYAPGEVPELLGHVIGNKITSRVPNPLNSVEYTFYFSPSTDGTTGATLPSVSKVGMTGLFFDNAPGAGQDAFLLLSAGALGTVGLGGTAPIRDIHCPIGSTSANCQMMENDPVTGIINFNDFASFDYQAPTNGNAPGTFIKNDLVYAAPLARDGTTPESAYITHAPGSDAVVMHAPDGSIVTYHDLHADRDWGGRVVYEVGYRDDSPAYSAYTSYEIDSQAPIADEGGSLNVGGVSGEVGTSGRGYPINASKIVGVPAIGGPAIERMSFASGINVEGLKGRPFVPDNDLKMPVAWATSIASGITQITVDSAMPVDIGSLLWLPQVGAAATNGAPTLTSVTPTGSGSMSGSNAYKLCQLDGIGGCSAPSATISVVNGPAPGTFSATRFNTLLLAAGTGLNFGWLACRDNLPVGKIPTSNTFWVDYGGPALLDPNLSATCSASSVPSGLSASVLSIVDNLNNTKTLTLSAAPSQSLPNWSGSVYIDNAPAMALVFAGYTSSSYPIDGARLIVPARQYSFFTLPSVALSGSLTFEGQGKPVIPFAPVGSAAWSSAALAVSPNFTPKFVSGPIFRNWNAAAALSVKDGARLTLKNIGIVGTGMTSTGIGDSAVQAWASGASYQNFQIVANGGYLYKNNGAAATAGATAPTCSTFGCTSNDGTINWVNIGLQRSFNLEMVDSLVANEGTAGLDLSGVANVTLSNSQLSSNNAGALFENGSTVKFAAVQSRFDENRQYAVRAVAGATLPFFAIQQSRFETRGEAAHRNSIDFTAGTVKSFHLDHDYINNSNSATANVILNSAVANASLKDIIDESNTALAWVVAAPGVLLENVSTTAAGLTLSGANPIRLNDSWGGSVTDTSTGASGTNRLRGLQAGSSNGDTFAYGLNTINQTATPTADFAMGSHKITGLTAASTSGDALAKGSATCADLSGGCVAGGGSVTMAGDVTGPSGSNTASHFTLIGDSAAGSHKITGLLAGTASADAMAFGLNHLNDLATATGNYAMGSNILTGLAAGASSGDSFAVSLNTINQTAAPTADFSFNSHKATSLLAGTASGHAMVFSLNHLNDLASATGNYAMGSNKLTGLPAGSGSGDSFAYALNTINQTAAPTTDFSMNSHKLTSVSAGTAAGDGLSYAQSGIPYVINRQGGNPLATFTNPTTTEETMYTFSLPAGTLGANGFMDCNFYGDMTNNTAGTQTVQFRWKIGGTTVGNGTTTTLAQSASIRPWWANLHFQNDGATNLNSFLGLASVLGAVGVTGNNAGSGNGASSTYSALALDTTGSLTVALTLTLNVGTATSVLNSYYGACTATP